MKINGSRNQRGAVVVLAAIALPVLLLAMGWALDFGHVFVNKTRLQNALDATALSAAIAINYDVTKDTEAATAKGIDTFNSFQDAPGNDELKGLTLTSQNFEYSRTLNPWGTFNAATDTFAFVKVTSTNMLQVQPVLIRIFRPEDIKVPAVATAGPVGNNCELMPFFLCADMTSPAGTYYGYFPNATYPLLDFKDPGITTPPAKGNYGLLDLEDSQGGHDIRLILQGKKPVNTCSLNNELPLDTDPGKKKGNVQKGLDYRIDTLDSNDDNYLSPKPPATSTAYTDYKVAGGNDKRLIAVPIGDCSTMTKPGNAKLDQVGTACVFLTVHYGDNPYTIPCPQHSVDPECSKDAVSFQFIRSCEVGGVWNPNNAILNGPYKIVLYKSPGSGDS